MPASDRPHILVLAAGKGERMGGPKALMDVGGRPWWQVQTERLSRVKLPVLWVVSPRVQAALPVNMASVLSNPEAPMFDSILTGIETLAAAPPAGVFVLPVDVPAPGSGVWSALAKSSQPAAPALNGSRGHPIYLPWDWVSRVLVPIADSSRGGFLRLDRLVEPSLVEVPVDDPGVCVNLNTPEDLRDWLAANTR